MKEKSHAEQEWLRWFGSSSQRRFCTVLLFGYLECLLKLVQSAISTFFFKNLDGIRHSAAPLLTLCNLLDIRVDQIPLLPGLNIMLAGIVMGTDYSQ